MLAYAVRRILLMIPTLFAIILVNFVIVQAAPGGPVDQLIAELKGTAGGTLARVSGGGGELTSSPTSAGETRGSRGLDPEFIKQIQKLYGFDKPAPERFWLMLENYLTFNFGKSFYQRPAGHQAHRRQAAGIDLARIVDDAAHLSHLDSARHPQGGARRQPVRHVDERRRHRGLCHPELPLRRAAHRAVRRRQLSLVVSAARAHLGQLGELRLAAPHPRLFLAHRAAGAVARDRQLRQPHHADQELASSRRSTSSMS